MDMARRRRRTRNPLFAKRWFSDETIIRQATPRRLLAARSGWKPSICSHCAGTDLVLRITTYPIPLGGPLEGKEMHVGRVALYECRPCGHLMPTPAGQAKIDRNVAMGIRLSLGQLH